MSQPTKVVRQQQSIPDPGIVYAERWRPLQRTDGQWFVYDPQLPPGKRTVGGALYASKALADGAARALAGLEPLPT